jgi:hypothetical protein
MFKCSVNGCFCDPDVSTEHLVAIRLRNESLYCQRHFDSIWATKHLTRCRNYLICNTKKEYSCDEGFRNPLRFVSKDPNTRVCHLCWLKANFPSVPIRSLAARVNTNAYRSLFFSEHDVISIIARQKRERIFPTVVSILYPILGKDVTNLILSMI